MNKEDDICWYHEKLTRKEAEQLLLQDGNVDGSFLVRRSGSSSGDFVLSVLHNNEVAHFQIRRHIDDAFFSIGMINYLRTIHVGMAARICFTARRITAMKRLFWSC